MEAVIWAAVILLLFPFLLVLGFGALSVGRLWIKDPECPTWLKLTLYVIVYGFWITDPLFNWTWGALIFRDGWKPTWRKITFSTRINAYFDSPGRCPNIRKRNLWARLLNLGVPGHIDTHGVDVRP